jgi:3-hydroxyacyl-[acyl-carrier-protein] dehydratase
LPSQPLVDLASLDLSHVLVGAEEVRRLCLQRNRFAMLDGILHIAEDRSLLVGFKDLTQDDWWAPDHIPGRPIFPGVLQLEAAAQLATWHFLSFHATDPSQFVGFGGLNETRFRGVVTPPARLLLVAKSMRVRQSMFTYAAQAYVEGKLVMETEILGVIV